MKNGYKIFDADTHINPLAETLEPYFDPEVRARIPEWEPFKVPFRIGWAGEKLEPPYRHRYQFKRRSGWRNEKLRVLGEAGPREHVEPHFPKFMGTRFPTPGAADDNVEARIKDMDEEGVDVQLMVPGTPPAADDVGIEMAFIRANHRFTDEFCSKYPRRLKSLIVVTSSAIEESVREIEKWAKARWAVGVYPHLAPEFPIDHPALSPIWAAADERGLCVVHHSFTSGYPGYRDLWDNPFIGRTASHPWGAMRAITALFGSGIMDKYPRIRFCILESGFGWLPFWAARMDDQSIYMSYALPPDLARRPSEYMTGGRFFASLVIHEGERMTKMVADFLGEGVLMYSSDYPHAESRFPESTSKVLAWKSLGDAFMRKLLWENAVRCFGEP
ncbi:MAG TPA: amidohydrolase family protein [Candidatus Acidoferrales bacterium]|nr:amidohydrolase family protein [Candidatus Acidoferrales bacterium]